MNRFRLPASGLIAATLTFIADQAVKAWVNGPLALQYNGPVDLLPFFRLKWSPNTGVSLGLLAAESDAMRWLLVLMTGVISVAVLFWMAKEKAKADIIALGLVLGGALGNILDRVRDGYVTDYADFHIGDYTPFIFNLADAAISIGVVIILARSLLLREKPPQETAPGASE